MAHILELVLLFSLWTLAQCAPMVNNTIAWGACPPDVTSSLPVDCANYEVPLDYTDKTSTRMLTLNMLRVPARKKPVKGSIFVNFGGPGEDARYTLAIYSALLPTYVLSASHILPVQVFRY